MIVICCGMYRAASTWQYNVACHLVERYFSGKRLGYQHHGSSLEERLRNLSNPSDWIIIKAHEPDPLFTELLTSGAAFAVYSYRDMRDVAYSITHKRNSTFEQEIEGTELLQQTIRNFHYWTGFSRSLVQRYEQITANPLKAVCEIATALGIALSANTAEDIARDYSLENNRARIDHLAEAFRLRGVDLTDPTNALCHDEKTLLHWNHIRDGRIGTWRQLATPRHLVILARECGQWLIEQGYEPDWVWAHPAFEYLLFNEHMAQQGHIKDLVKHLDAHRESLVALHEHLANERAEVAMLREKVRLLQLENVAQRGQVMDLVNHLDAHRESLMTLHEHLANERAEVAILREQLQTL